MSDDPSLVRNAWIDEQMRHATRRSVAETVRNGLVAGLGTTCSTLTVALMKWLFLLVIASLR
jgi:hypothetical protein